MSYRVVQNFEGYEVLAYVESLADGKERTTGYTLRHPDGTHLPKTYESEAKAMLAAQEFAEQDADPE